MFWRIFLVLIMALWLPLFGGCKKKVPPKKPEKAPVTVPQQTPLTPSKPKFSGSRMGPLLADVSVWRDNLVSHPETRTQSGSYGTYQIPIPVVSQVPIHITLSNDTGRSLDLQRDFNFRGNTLFTITIQNRAGRTVFQHRQPLGGISGWAVDEVKKYSPSWSVREVVAPGQSWPALGEYSINIDFGFGGRITRYTRLR